MKKPKIKNIIFLVLSASFAASIFFYFSSGKENKTTIEKPKTSVTQEKPSIQPKPTNEPVNFVDVPLSAVCAYYYDVHKISIQPGQHGERLVSLAGHFQSGRQAKNALVEMLEKQGLYLGGVPLRIYAKAPEPVFTRVDWGMSGGQIYIFHGSKLYKVQEFPFMLRRDNFGNFHAALPAGTAVDPATAGSAAVPAGKA